MNTTAQNAAKGQTISFTVAGYQRRDDRTTTGSVVAKKAFNGGAGVMLQLRLDSGRTVWHELPAELPVRVGK